MTFHIPLPILIAIIFAALATFSDGQEPSLTSEQKSQLKKTDRLNVESMKFYENGDYAEAIKLVKQILQIHETILGPDHENTAESLNILAFLYKSQGNYAAAEPMLKRALAITEKTLGPDHESTADSLNSLAFVYDSQGNYAAAEPMYQRALAIREKALGPDHESTATSLHNLAGLYTSRGNYAAAEPMYQRALAIREKALGPNHERTVDSLNNLALLYESQGNYAAAEPMLKRAVAITGKEFGPDHPSTATSLNNLAGLYKSQGSYSAAEPMYKRALAIYEKALGPDHPSTATSLNNLAGLYESLGNYAAAEPMYKRALAIKEKALGPNHESTVDSLHNLAGLYKSQGNYAVAEPMYQRALAITEKALGPEHKSTATRLTNLAFVYHSQGNYAAAEPMYKRALVIRENALGPDHPSTATSLNNLAGLYASQWNYAAAEPMYKRALAIWEKALGSDHPTTATSLNNLAALYEVLNRVESRNIWDRSRQGTSRHVVKVLPALSEKEQQLFIEENYAFSFESALSAALRHRGEGSSVSLSASWVINGKGVAQDAIACRNLAMRDLSDPKLVPLVKQLNEARARLATIAMSGAETGNLNERKLMVEKLSSEESGLSKELSVATGTQADRPEWVELDKLRRALPSESVFIDIARFKVFNFEAKGKDKKSLPARYAAWVTPPEGKGDPMLIDLGLAEEIDNLLQSVRSMIAVEGSSKGAIQTSGEADATAKLNQEMQKLANRIWKPLAEHVGDAKSIILSPDGALWLAPWNALPIDNEGQVLLQKYSIRLVISGRDIVKNRDTKLKTSPAVIFANPKFNSTGPEKRSSIEAVLKEVPKEDDGTLRSFSAKGLLPSVMSLPNTATEAKLISPNVEKITRLKPQLYEDRYALESITKELKRPKIAIFATHGFFLPSQEAKKDDGFALASSESRSLGLDTNGKPLENPLLRCGLLFAGCNQRGVAVGDDDGILTGMEITSIDFRGTDMVVLSACETGVGDVNNGEGVAGLRQAFQLAGAKAVIASLWQVPDRDSAVIMNDFFENVAAGQAASEAMRQAQLKRIESRTNRYGAAHPLFWAAWTVTE